MPAVVCRPKAGPTDLPSWARPSDRQRSARSRGPRPTAPVLSVPASPVAVPDQGEATDTVTVIAPDTPWVTIVWNDPVNLMSYVTWVFQKLLGHPKPKAHALMLDVHHKGRATVSSGPREQMEADVAKLQGAGLWATMAPDS